MTTLIPPRLVTLRRAISGRWVTEAPHPQYPSIPQPYSLPGLRASAWDTLAAARKAIEEAGYVAVKPAKSSVRIIYRGVSPFLADQ
jgi:hypothetical protein